MKKATILLGAFAIALCMASCSQEEQEQQAQVVNAPQQQYTSVEELTAQLKIYDQQFMTSEQPVKRIKVLGQKISLLDCLKIAIADVKGGMAGYKEGGTSQAIIGACVASAVKLVEILDNKMAKIEKVKPQEGLLKSNGTISYNDSIGFYHMDSEKKLYEKYGNQIKSINNVDLLCLSHNLMRQVSSGYVNNNSFSTKSLMNTTNALNGLRHISDNADIPYSEYYAKVRALSPSDGEYLDFASEYIYTTLMGNVGDIKEYTNNVLRQIDNSNATGEDKKILAQCIYIAHSSLVFSSSTETAQ